MARVRVLPHGPKSAGEDGFSPFNPLASLLDGAIEVILVGMLAFAPWPFGSVARWSEEVLIVGAACLALCLVLRLIITPGKQVVRSWAYVPMGLFLALTLFQLIPFPPSALRYISPHTVVVKSSLLADIPGASSAPMTVTFYRWITLHDLRLVLALGTVFVVVINTARSLRRVKRLLVSITIIGSAVVLLALAQDLSGTDKIYWVYKEFMVKAIGGPFLNHSHFCQYLSLTIGAALSLLLISARRNQPDRNQSGQSVAESSRIRSIYLLALGVVIAAAAAAVCLSASRAGMIATLAAAAVIVVINAIRRHRRDGWIFSACVALIAIGVFAYAESDVSRRLATLQHPLTEYNARWQIMKDIAANWRHFPLLGVGLGNHEVAYPMIEHLIYTPVFDHAENEFAQMLEETGALGLAAVFGFLSIISHAFFRALGAGGTIRAAALGLGFGFIAIVVQSVSDFGQHIPAIALLTAVECALLINLARLRATRAPRTALAPNLGRFRVAVLIVAAGGIGLAYVIAIQQADRARVAQSIWRPSHAVADSVGLSVSHLSDEQFREIVENAAAAHHADPDDIFYPYQMANFKWSSLEVKHDPTLLEDVRSDDEKMIAKDLYDKFNEIRCTCPCYGAAVFMAGEISYYVFDASSGADLIRLASRMTSTNPQFVIQAALVNCDQDRYADAVAACRHYLELRGVIHGDFYAVAYALVIRAGRPDLAIPLADNDPERLLEIVHELRRLPERTDFQTLAASLEKQANANRKTLLMKSCEQPDAPAADVAALADIYRSEHDLDQAIIYYRRALISNYDQIDWRLKLSQALLDVGRKGEAEQEAAIVLRLHPDSQDARKLIFNATGSGGTSSGQ